MQGGSARKRRPPSSSKSIRSKLDSGSQVSQFEQNWHRPLPAALIAKKYYYPAILQQQRHTAYLITRYLAGCRTRDELQLTELMTFSSRRELMGRVYDKPLGALRWAATEGAHSGRLGPLPHFHSQAYFILGDNGRRRRQLESTCRERKEGTGSTRVDSKKEILNVLGDGFTRDEREVVLNETQELGRLSRCLKRALGRHDSGRTYKAFVAEMERKGEGVEQSQGMMKLILNLDKDFSSIRQEECDFSKQSIYGLSDLKKKSQRNNSKLQTKPKDKRLSTNFPFCRMEFTKRPAKDTEKSSNPHSTSKNSRKSSSLRSRKQGNVITPDNHGVKSKSKSSAKKKIGAIPEKKSKLTDTQILYFGESGGKDEKEEKSSVRQGLHKGEGTATKSKKRVLKR